MKINKIWKISQLKTNLQATQCSKLIMTKFSIINNIILYLLAQNNLKMIYKLIFFRDKYHNH